MPFVMKSAEEVMATRARKVREKHIANNAEQITAFLNKGKHAVKYNVGENHPACKYSDAQCALARAYLAANKQMPGGKGKMPWDAIAEVCGMNYLTVRKLSHKPSPATPVLYRRTAIPTPEQVAACVKQLKEMHAAHESVKTERKATNRQIRNAFTYMVAQDPNASAEESEQFKADAAWFYETLRQVRIPKPKTIKALNSAVEELARVAKQLNIPLEKIVAGRDAATRIIDMIDKSRHI